MRARRAATIATLLLAFAGGIGWQQGLTPLRSDPSAIPQNNWKLILDRPIVGKYEDLVFADANNGWVVDALGRIIHTADGGTTWTEQATGRGPLRSVDFIDAKRGFAGTLSGTLYATTNGGTTWNDITGTLPRAAKGFCGMTHVGETIHLVGRYVGAADYFMSPDAGKTWSVSDLGALAQGLVDVAFINDSIGFIGGRGKNSPGGASGDAIVLKTTDGGRNWRNVYRSNIPGSYIWKLFVVSATVTYAALESSDGIYHIAKTTDSGESWRTMTVATTPTRGSLQGIGFVDEKNGWVGGFLRGMYVTTDGGESWSHVPVAISTVNRYEKVGGTLVTAGSTGIHRLEARAP